jgi:hypothetical protein
VCRGREVVGLCGSPWTRGGDYYYYARSVEQEGGGERGMAMYKEEERRYQVWTSTQSPVAMCFELNQRRH